MADEPRYQIVYGEAGKQEKDAGISQDLNYQP
jgi:hypothetical protein